MHDCFDNICSCFNIICSVLNILNDYIQCCRGRGSSLKVEWHWPEGALLYMIKIKRFYFFHKPDENFRKYGISITLD
jgi:hypothetical protein